MNKEVSSSGGSTVGLEPLELRGVEWYRCGKTVTGILILQKGCEPGIVTSSFFIDQFYKVWFYRKSKARHHSDIIKREGWTVTFSFSHSNLWVNIQI